MSELVEDRSLTIRDFCAAESISKAFYHQLQRKGLGPATYCPVGTKAVRITAQARRDWHERMAELSKQEVAQRERERRQEIAKAAGKKAVKSPKHIASRRKAASN
jgi:hypothetical protein